MSVTALMVIDMQRWFFRRELPVHRADELLGNVNALLGAFHTAGLPVLLIRHTNDTYLARGIPDWQLVEGLDIRKGDMLLDKTARDSFGEPAVIEALAACEAGGVVIAGLVTHGCLQAACLGGLRLGYAVTLAADAHSSFDADAAGLIKRWNATLADEGARVLATGDILPGRGNRTQAEGKPGMT